MNKRIRLVILGVLVVLAASIACQARVLAATPFTDVSFIFTMPNELKDRWELTSSNANSDNGKSTYIYDRKAIVDNAGRRIIPGMILTFDSMKQKMDLALYAGMITTQLGKIMNFNIDKVEPINNTLLYKVRFMDKFNVEHTVFWQFGVFQYKDAYYGVRAWLDGTTPVFSQVEDEMKQIVLKISKSL